MSSRLSFVLFIVKIFGDISALVELPQVDKNNILETDLSIRETTNKLFSILKLNVNERPSLKQYSLIHNYLVSTSLQDYTNLIEIAKLTRVDKIKLNHQTKHFMAIINEILNEDIKHDTNIKDGYVINHIEGFIKNLDEYTDTYKYNENNVDYIVNELIKVLESNDTISEEHLQDNLDTDYSWLESPSEISDNITVINKNEFWEPSGRRIFGGRKTSIRDFPFMASIQIFNHFQCAGSIIKSDLIITAASCLQLAWNNRFFRENPAFLSARVGSTYHNVGGEIIPIIEVYFHPSYDPRSLYNNLALTRLQRALHFTRKKGVKKIPIDRKAHALPTNTRGITIVGWGARTSSNIIGNPYLSFAVLDFYLHRDCQDVYSKKYVTQKNFCAGFISVGSGACNRDIGGPGIANGILVGVVSFGSPVCGTPDAPTVFTKLGFYFDWIDRIMRQKVPKAHVRTTTLRPFQMTVPHHDKETQTTFLIKPITFTKRTTNALRTLHDKDHESYSMSGSKEHNILREVTIKSTKKHISERIPLSPFTTLKPLEQPITQLNKQDDVLNNYVTDSIKEMLNTLIGSTKVKNLLLKSDKSTELNVSEDQQISSVEDSAASTEVDVELSNYRKDHTVMKADVMSDTYEVLLSKSFEVKDELDNKIIEQEVKDQQLDAKLEQDIINILDDINLEDFVIKKDTTTTANVNNLLMTTDQINQPKLKDIFTLLYFSDLEQTEGNISDERNNSVDSGLESNSDALRDVSLHTKKSTVKDSNEENNKFLLQIVTDVLREELMKRFKDKHLNDVTQIEDKNYLQERAFKEGHETVFRDKNMKTESMRIFNNIRITKSMIKLNSRTVSKIIPKKHTESRKDRKTSRSYNKEKSKI